MNRFLIAAALTLAFGLGTTTRAQAQIVYGYSVPTYGGVQTQGVVVNPFSTQTFTNYYSPFTFTNQTVGATYTPFGVQGYSNYYSPFAGSYSQLYGGNLFGGGYYRGFGYNPWNGVTGGVYNPITRPTVINPAFGYGGSYFRR